MVSGTMQVSLPIPILFALFLSVLSIYNLDHLLDARKLNTEARSYRHAFYQQHIQAMVSWQVVLALVSIPLLFYLPLKVLYAGGALVVVIGLYFTIIFKQGFSMFMLRELAVALGYTLAVAVVPFAQVGFCLNYPHILLIINIALVAITNIWLFAYFDSDIDLYQQQASITRKIGAIQLHFWIKGLLWVTVLSIAWYLWVSRTLAGVGLLFVELVYVVLFFKNAFFKPKEFYRLFGEFALLIPGALYLLYYAI